MIALTLLPFGLIFATWLSSINEPITVVAPLFLIGYVAILRVVFSLLFPVVIVLPTCVLAWTQPDPLEEV